MKISSAPVSYQTHVRPAQVHDMIRCCEALQQTFDRLTYMTTNNPGHFLNVSKAPDLQIVASQWPRQPEINEFKKAALNNHFVCANWKAFDELAGEGYRSRAELLTARSLVPVDADFMWVRRFIHSVVIWEINTIEPYPPTLRVALAIQGWKGIANALQKELNKIDGSDDPWKVLRK